MATWLKFDATIIRQREDAPAIAVFACDAYSIREFATVSRKGEDADGYQRWLNPRKVSAIAKYVDTAQSILPTAVVLAAEKDAKAVQVGKLRPIPGTRNQWKAQIKIRAGLPKKPCLIIDGQHRVFGVVGSTHKSYPLPVCIVLDADLVTQLLHFIVINNKTTGIKANLINELLADLAKLTKHDKDRLNRLMLQLGVRSVETPYLVAALNDQGMVFQGILDFQSNDLPLVSSASLSKVIDESKRDGVLSHIDDSDLQVDAINYLWEGVKKAFPKRWKLETDLLREALANKAAKEKAKAQADSAKGRKKAKGSRAKKRQAKEEAVTMKIFNKKKRLFHSGTILVLGGLIDKELSRAGMRRQWQIGLQEPQKLSIIRDLVERDVLRTLKDSYWDGVEIDNTTKGRKALAKALDAQIASSD